MESAAPRCHFTLHGRLTPSDSAPQTRFSPSFAVQVWFALTRSRMRHRQSSVRPRRLQDSGPPASGPGSECANIASTSSDNIIPATGLRKTLARNRRNGRMDTMAEGEEREEGEEARSKHNRASRSRSVGDTRRLVYRAGGNCRASNRCEIYASSSSASPNPPTKTNVVPASKHRLYPVLVPSNHPPFAHLKSRPSSSLSSSPISSLDPDPKGKDLE